MGGREPNKAEHIVLPFIVYTPHSRLNRWGLPDHVLHGRKTGYNILYTQSEEEIRTKQEKFAYMLI
jgi:hypothetical protein